MQSIFSKLGADGEPIHDERGKIRKVPNYREPSLKFKRCSQGKRDAGSQPACNDRENDGKAAGD